MRRLGSNRAGSMGSAIFAEVGQWRAEAAAQGRDLIDLGIGSPDLPPDPQVRRTLAEAALRPDAYGYPMTDGSSSFRQAVADWYAHRFGVELDPKREVLSLMGSQDGLAHLALAVADYGDLAIVPDPGYPIYGGALALAGVQPYLLPLKPEHDFLPVLEEIPEEVARKAAYLLLNYPSNPLSAVADLAFFEKLVWYGRKHDLLLVHDLAYSEMAFDGFRPPSLLQVPGAKEIAVELNSLSKSFNLAGSRVAYMVGNAEAVEALRTVKNNIDYGVFLPVQEAAVAALRGDIAAGGFGKAAAVYERRRNTFIPQLHKAGWEVPQPRATMFVWARVPDGWTSRQISREMTLQTGVVMIPGDAFGPSGAGFVRIALVQDETRLQEAAARIGYFLNQRIDSV